MIVATPLGSSAYSLAGGGAILAAGTAAFLCTPLAMHARQRGAAGRAGRRSLTVDVYPGYAGFDVEIDGRAAHLRAATCTSASRCTRTAQPRHVRDDVGRGLASLRRRGIIADSPRIAIRDNARAPTTV